jgi:hypothetical protein
MCTQRNKSGAFVSLSRKTQILDIHIVAVVAKVSIFELNIMRIHVDLQIQWTETLLDFYQGY